MYRNCTDVVPHAAAPFAPAMVTSTEKAVLWATVGMMAGSLALDLFVAVRNGSIISRKKRKIRAEIAELEKEKEAKMTEAAQALAQGGSDGRRRSKLSRSSAGVIETKILDLRKKLERVAPAFCIPMTMDVVAHLLHILWMAPAGVALGLLGDKGCVSRTVVILEMVSYFLVVLSLTFSRYTDASIIVTTLNGAHQYDSKSKCRSLCSRATQFLAFIVFLSMFMWFIAGFLDTPDSQTSGVLLAVTAALTFAAWAPTAFSSPGKDSKILTTFAHGERPWWLPVREAMAITIPLTFLGTALAMGFASSWPATRPRDVLVRILAMAVGRLIVSFAVSFAMAFGPAIMARRVQLAVAKEKRERAQKENAVEMTSVPGQTGDGGPGEQDSLLSDAEKGSKRSSGSDINFAAF